jgi:hypothetical protein
MTVYSMSRGNFPSNHMQKVPNQLKSRMIECRDPEMLVPQAPAMQDFHPIFTSFFATICCILEGSTVASMG